MNQSPDQKSIADLLLPPVEWSQETVLTALQHGKLQVYGLMPWSSNYTFLGQIDYEDTAFNIIYKPCQGERPLWDFPEGTLCRREVAAFELSRALGFPYVPPTVLRPGPYGAGSVQQYIHTDYSRHYFVLQDDPAFQTQFQQMVAFDWVANNADRKGGHCLPDDQDRVWAIDHGLTFNEVYKFRTVIWAYAGELLPQDIVIALEKVVGDITHSQTLQQHLTRLLSPGEIEALLARINTLRRHGTFPQPTGGHDVPYPPL